jgi:hypothetical protein
LTLDLHEEGDHARLRSVDGELIYEAGGAVIPRWFAGAEKREVA